MFAYTKRERQMCWINLAKVASETTKVAFQCWNIQQHYHQQTGKMVCVAAKLCFVVMEQ